MSLPLLPHQLYHAHDVLFDIENAMRGEDEFGRQIVGRQVRSGEIATYEYDALGRLTREVRSSSDDIHEVTTTLYHYDALGNRTGSAPFPTTTYHYDAAGNRTDSAPLPGPANFTFAP